MSVLTAVVILASVAFVFTAGAGSVLWVTIRGSARETQEFVRSTREAVLHSAMEFRKISRENQQILMRSEKTLRDLSIMIGRIDERTDK